MCDKDGICERVEECLQRLKAEIRASALAVMRRLSELMERLSDGD